MLYQVIAATVLLLISNFVHGQRHSDEPQTKSPQSVGPLFQVVDLNIGEESILEMANGKSVKVKPISLDESRDSIRDAVRSAKVVVEIDGETVTLTSGNKSKILKSHRFRWRELLLTPTGQFPSI